MLAPWLFTAVFGNQWALTGDIAQILTALYFFRFIVSPLSYNYYLANRHSEDLMLQGIGFASIVILFLYAESAEISFGLVLSLFSAVFSAIYFLYGVRSLIFARMPLIKNNNGSE
jgi:O-antigen/teichoic acid export membrane protein